MAKTSMNGSPDRSLSVQSVAVSSLRLAGRRIAVVGGTDGLGRAIAKLAAERGADVLVVGRTFRDEGTAGLRFLRADLSSMAEARRVGRELPASLDVVVFTTGIIAATRREVTAEGIERDMAISYLSRLAIVRELAPRLAKEARVFVMGFPGTGQQGDASDLNAEQGYDAMKVHMNTVAGNEMLVLDAQRRYPGVSFFGLNPGLVKTNIRANYLGEGSLKHRAAELLIGLFTPTPERYAARVVPLFVAPELAGRSGVMFGKKGQPILPTEGLDEERVTRFIDASWSLIEKVAAAPA